MASRRDAPKGRGPRDGRPPGPPHHPPGPPHRLEHDSSTGSADEPLILNGTGNVTLAPGERCIWEPSNGADSFITVRNDGLRNTLTCDITGAPPHITGTQSNGAPKPLNGRWKIPPNMPTAEVRASGDFEGHRVTIINNSDPETTCHVFTNVPGS